MRLAVARRQLLSTPSRALSTLFAPTTPTSSDNSVSPAPSGLPSSPSPLNGVFAVYKPPGVTSTRLLNSIKYTLSRHQPAPNGARRPLVKAGHGGTLDPLAEGVLVVGVGSGCKQLSSYLGSSKCYTVTAQLGSATDTYDADGKVTNEAVAAVVGAVTGTHIREALTTFVGSIQQRPPVYSAVHVNGRRAHQLARSGRTVVIPEREVEVHRAEVSHYDADKAQVVLRLWTGKGTYVRSIVHDLGVALGCYAHVTRLIRDQQGRWVVKRANTIADEQEALRMEDLTTENVQRVISATNNTVPASSPQPVPISRPSAPSRTRPLSSSLMMASRTSPLMSARCFSSSSRQSSSSRSQPSSLPLFDRAVKYGTAPAISSHSSTYTYAQLLHDAANLRDKISSALSSSPASSSAASNSSSTPPSVAFLVPPSYQHVVATYGVWAAGAVSVPLHMGHKEGEISYLLEDSDAKCVVVTEQEQERLAPLAKQRNIPMVVIPNQVDVKPLTELQSDGKALQSTSVDKSAAALLIYTSGTTGKPKVNHNMTHKRWRYD